MGASSGRNVCVLPGAGSVPSKCLTRTGAASICSAFFGNPETAQEIVTGPEVFVAIILPSPQPSGTLPTGPAKRASPQPRHPMSSSAPSLASATTKAHKPLSVLDLPDILTQRFRLCGGVISVVSLTVLNELEVCISCSLPQRAIDYARVEELLEGSCPTYYIFRFGY
jgi:hypothetical protein